MASDDSVIDPIYPAKVFVFHEDGTHGGPFATLHDTEGLTRLMNDETFKAFFRSGNEIRITDPMDNCLFHAKDGTIIFPATPSRG